MSREDVSRGSWDILPEIVCIKILQLLPLKDKIVLTRVCRDWKSLINEQLLVLQEHIWFEDVDLGTTCADKEHWFSDYDKVPMSSEHMSWSSLRSLVSLLPNLKRVKFDEPRDKSFLNYRGDDGRQLLEIFSVCDIECFIAPFFDLHHKPRDICLPHLKHLHLQKVVVNVFTHPEVFPVLESLVAEIFHQQIEQLLHYRKGVKDVTSSRKPSKIVDYRMTLCEGLGFEALAKSPAAETLESIGPVSMEGITCNPRIPFFPRLKCLTLYMTAFRYNETVAEAQRFRTRMIIEKHRQTLQEITIFLDHSFCKENEEGVTFSYLLNGLPSITSLGFGGIVRSSVTFDLIQEMFPNLKHLFFHLHWPFYLDNTDVIACLTHDKFPELKTLVIVFNGDPKTTMLLECIMSIVHKMMVVGGLERLSFFLHFGASFFQCCQQTVDELSSLPDHITVEAAQVLCRSSIQIPIKIDELFNEITFKARI